MNNPRGESTTKSLRIITTDTPAREPDFGGYVQYVLHPKTTIMGSEGEEPPCRKNRCEMCEVGGCDNWVTTTYFETPRQGAGLARRIWLRSLTFLEQGELTRKRKRN